jgi:hypothetical protein
MDPLSERQLEQARDVREKILLLKWQKRQRVTRAEADELRPVIGEVEYAKLLSIIEAAPSEPASRTEYGSHLQALCRRLQGERTADHPLGERRALRAQARAAAAGPFDTAR